MLEGERRREPPVREAVLGGQASCAARSRTMIDVDKTLIRWTVARLPGAGEALNAGGGRPGVRRDAPGSSGQGGRGSLAGAL